MFDQFVSGAKARRKVFARSEDGSLIIFSLFVFILILMMSGMAVDMMRHENKRVQVQQTIDTAVIASSSLKQTRTTQAEIEELIEEYFVKAGLDPSMVTVAPATVESLAGGTATGRAVSASANFGLNTMFMSFMGIDSLQGTSAGAAQEGQQLIEIALVLDVSGSMGRNNRLENLKVAAKDFVSFVIEANGDDRVSISIIPYNHFVYADDDLRTRLDWANTPSTVPDTELLTLADGAPHPGAIRNYNTRNAASRCSVFSDEDFATRSLTDSGKLVASGLYAKNGDDFSQPEGEEYWCSEDTPRVMLYENSIATLHTHIDNLSADGWTAIDYGMNWGVAVLDPDFAPIISGMVDDKLLPERMANHPAPYDTPDTVDGGESVLKYVILMTDGVNTRHNDLRDEYKSGPSRVWFSQEKADEESNNYAGYAVEMPDNAADRRWYIPNNPDDAADDEWLPASPVLPESYVQQSYHQIYARFRLDAAAEYFFGTEDPAAYTAHLEANSEIDIGGYGTADIRTQSICDSAAIDDRIEVFTVAFEAPIDAQTVLSDCVSKPGRYFNVDGTEISAAFASIAAQISQLRLTQ
ncbi:VWA domain-containing protein [bacterium]|nr:VWA domain-containing protein [bacterium]